MNPFHPDEMDEAPMLMTHPSHISQALNASLPMDFRTISTAQRATLRAQAGSVTEIGIARASAVSHIQVVQAVQAPEGTSAGPPEGWNVYPHDDHGQFYENPLTGETMWPSFPGAPTLPRAPKGWEVHPHAEHGQYYHNPVTKQTLWTRPGGEAVAAAATAHDNSEWVTCFSDDHGANYYKHRVTGEERWEMPAEHGAEKVVVKMSGS